MSFWKLITGRWGSGAGDTADIRIDASTNSLQCIAYPHHKIHAGSHFFLEGHATLGNGGTLFVKLVTPNSDKWGHFLWDINASGIMTTTFDEDATGGMANGSRPTIHANNRNTNCWTGAHTGGNGEATVMTDGGASFVTDALIGMTIFNTTDSSSGVITDNDGTTVTVAALAGGTDNDWDTNDDYEINQTRMVITKAVTACTGYTQRISETSFGSRQGGAGDARTNELVLKKNTVYCRSFTSGVASNILNFRASWYEHQDINT